MIAIIVLALAACNTAGSHFRGLPATRVTVEGSVFDVRVRGELAEALRVNPQYAPRLGRLHERARFAMARVSGCDVIRVSGDQAQLTGELSCDVRAPEWRGRAGAPSYSCTQQSTWSGDVPGGPFHDYDCDPY